MAQRLPFSEGQPANAQIQPTIDRQAHKKLLDKTAVGRIDLRQLMPRTRVRRRAEWPKDCAGWESCRPRSEPDRE
jgi:hypothetical protein